jgi:hypothetical protein
VKAPTLDPVSNWVARAESIPHYLDEAIGAKSQKMCRSSGGAQDPAALSRASPVLPRYVRVASRDDLWVNHILNTIAYMATPAEVAWTNNNNDLYWQTDLRGAFDPQRLFGALANP